MSKNYENYRSGFYHQDIVDALSNLHDVNVHGPGYPGFSQEDTAQGVINRHYGSTEPDLIFFSTSWDDDRSLDSVDPSPNLDFSGVNITKAYFLNKEYKKLELRKQYIAKQKMDIVITLNPELFRIGDLEKFSRVVLTSFAHNPRRFHSLGIKKSFDFAFSGGLHLSHLDYRAKAKSEIFLPKMGSYFSSENVFQSLNSRRYLRPDFGDYRVFWADTSQRSFRKLPHGDRYNLLLNKATSFLNTPSAGGIVNTRYFELMATGTLIVSPRINSISRPEFLEDGRSFLEYEPSPGALKETLTRITTDPKMVSKITGAALAIAQDHTYEVRINEIFRAAGLAT